MMIARLRQLAGLAALALLMTGCVAASTESDAPELAETEAAQATTVLLDVRTPQEFADGHLEDAINIDVSAPDFDALISELPRDDHYVVYCRTGNRSAAATATMTSLGFTSVEDAGSVADASRATGVPVTTP